MKDIINELANKIEENGTVNKDFIFHIMDEIYSMELSKKYEYNFTKFYVYSYFLNCYSNKYSAFLVIAENILDKIRLFKNLIIYNYEISNKFLLVS